MSDFILDDLLPKEPIPEEAWAKPDPDKVISTKFKNCNECKYLEKCIDAERIHVWDCTHSFDDFRREEAFIMVGRKCPIDGMADKESEQSFDFASFCEQQIFVNGEGYDFERLLKLYKQKEKVK